MNVDLFENEKVLVCLEGNEYQPSALMRLIIRPFKLIFGRSTRIQMVLTDRKVHLYREDIVLWFIISGRSRQFLELREISGFGGMQTTSLFVFKSFNITLLSGGVYFAGLNLRSATYSSMEELINRISLVMSGQSDV